MTIAHRRETTIKSDKVLVLRSGRVREFDSLRNLLKKEEGLFSRIVALIREGESSRFERSS